MRRILIASLASMIALPALARNPQPTQSDVVIHLFGPNFISVTNSSTGSAGNPATPSAPGTAENSPASSAQASSAQSPSLHQMLRQLFVTGDPADNGKPHFSHGRERAQNQ